MSEGLNEFSVIEPVQIKPVLNTTLSATIAASIGVLHSKITKESKIGTTTKIFGNTSAIVWNTKRRYR